MNKLINQALSSHKRNGFVSIEHYPNRDYQNKETHNFTILSDAIEFIQYVYQTQNDDLSII
jgi:hypothetical protein